MQFCRYSCGVQLHFVLDRSLAHQGKEIFAVEHPAKTCNLLQPDRQSCAAAGKVKVKRAVPLRSVGGVLISLSRPLSP